MDLAYKTLRNRFQTEGCQDGSPPLPAHPAETAFFTFQGISSTVPPGPRGCGSHAPAWEDECHSYIFRKTVFQNLLTPHLSG